jgi:hypothetical protein
MFSETQFIVQWKSWMKMQIRHPINHPQGYGIGLKDLASSVTPLLLWLRKSNKFVVTAYRWFTTQSGTALDCSHGFAGNAFLEAEAFIPSTTACYDVSLYIWHEVQILAWETEHYCGPSLPNRKTFDLSTRPPYLEEFDETAVAAMELRRG